MWRTVTNPGFIVRFMFLQSLCPVYEIRSHKDHGHFGEWDIFVLPLSCLNTKFVRLLSFSVLSFLNCIQCLHMEIPTVHVSAYHRQQNQKSDNTI